MSVLNALNIGKRGNMFHFKIDLLKDNILKALLLFAFPILIANIFQQLYNTMDTMIVGNFLGDTSLAAISACGAVYELNDENQIKKSVAGSIVIGIGLTLLIMLISLLFLYPLLQLLHTPIHIIDEAYSYIFVVTIFVGVMFAYNLCAGLLRAIGNSVMPLIFLIISSLINVGLDILLITQFAMGVQGAAVATVISQAISVILCIFYIYIGKF